jgi:8-amino-7-oxononanoate synthase
VSPLDYLADELSQLDARGLRRRLRPIDGPQNAVLQVDGRTALNFSSNNYLGLADTPHLRDAAITALHEDGVGSGASRLIAGNLRPLRRLEQKLAAFHGTKAALLFTSGYQANTGTLSALAGPDDVIFSDALNHASLIDGSRLSRATVSVYRHLDLNDLAHRLATTPGRRRFVVTDTVFSMDGDLAPLRELRALCDQTQTALLLDEAHATFILGPQGQGLAASSGVRADVHIATMGKALGTFGAYVAGSTALVDYLANRARSFVFTTALPPSIAAASEAALALTLSPQGDELRARLLARIAQFREGLRHLRLLAPGAGHTPIFPVLVGDDRQVMEASERLLEQGIYAQGIRPPTVPEGTARLRFALMATHEPQHVQRALAALDLLLQARILRPHP